MAKGNLLSDSAYNQTGSKDDSPERKDPYNEYEGTIARHGSSDGADLEGTVNSRSGEIMGHGRPRDPHSGKGKK